jgi:signal transduction histidine kinase/DNA-binding response OmpR family regulator
VTTSASSHYLILVIEDDPFMRLQLRSFLKAEGYEVVEADDGEQGLAAYMQQQPDLVLLDALMPVMDGFTCCKKLRQISDQQHIPILMITGLEDQASVDRAFEVGTTDFVTKPIHWAVLRQRIRRLIEANQAATALQQLNANLEQEVLARTIQLQQSLEFEATLKRITDKVRDSLDEGQILQTVVQELALALRVDYCATAVFTHTVPQSIVCYDYPNSLEVDDNNWEIHLVGSPEIRAQLLWSRYLQFCSLPDQSSFPLSATRATALVCPIFDDHELLGELWLLNPPDYAFSELETRLVQQVTNQCAIAIRQARLYQAAQSQVKELESLNSLKDDFLSTVSHELRTPVANMKMAIQMIELSMKRVDPVSEQLPEVRSELHRTSRYFQILNEECNREMHLINDLLDLQRLDVGAQLLIPTPISLQTWLPHLIDSFEHRFQQQQQTLKLYIDPQLPTIVCDMPSLERIMTELLNNACKYTPIGETISITADLDIDRTVIKITSHGIEIPADQLPKVFDRFYRIPNSDPWKQGGTGLGLALVRKLVEYLGGSIQAISTTGQTCFLIELPLRS